MSTNARCEQIEVEPGRWFYLLEDDFDENDDEDDWRETAAIHGPFATEAEMDAHLHRTYPNPGGARVTRYEDGYEPDETLAWLLLKATR